MQMRHDMLTHGVNIVAAQHEGNKRGLSVAWATQVATDRILVCVGKQSATRDLILESKAFGLSVLRADQFEVSRTFGTKSSKDVDKFEGIAHHTAKTGSPLLDDCGAAFDCVVEAVHEQGEARLIIGRIVSAEFRSKRYEPLIYREEEY